MVLINKTITRIFEAFSEALNTFRIRLKITTGKAIIITNIRLRPKYFSSRNPKEKTKR